MDADLNEKEAFRLGFLARCAEEGLTGEQLQSRIKLAGDKQAGVGTWLGYLLGSAPAVGLAGGAALGYGAAKMMAPDVDEEDIKAKELAETYKIYEQRARAKRKAHQYRQQRP